MDVKILANDIKNNIQKVIIGKDKVIDIVVTALICGGHVLLEDVPGTGKTVLARSLAKSVDCDFKRVQFTPDLMPSDLTGINYYNQKLGEFTLRKGPVFTNILLADEINRATPRTQSSLLECMEETQVSIDGTTYILEKPFFVIASQNPVESQGTFPLPEAQLDRFFMKISMGYPDFSEEKSMMDRFMFEDPLEKLEAVVTMEEINYVQKNYAGVHVSSEIKDYILELITATRKHKNIELGCSPRASLNLLKGSQALAAIRGRDYVLPEDVKEMAIPILSHRLILKSSVNMFNNKSEEIVQELLNTVQAPLEKL